MTGGDDERISSKSRLMCSHPSLHLSQKRTKSPPIQDDPKGTTDDDEVEVVAAPFKKREVVELDDNGFEGGVPLAAVSEPKNLLVDSSSGSKQTKKREASVSASKSEMKRPKASQAKLALRAKKETARPSSSTLPVAPPATNAVAPGKDDSDDKDEADEIDENEKRRLQDEKNKIEVRMDMLKRNSLSIIACGVRLVFVLTQLISFLPHDSQDDMDDELDSTFRSQIQSSNFNYKALAGQVLKQIKTKIRGFFKSNKSVFLKFGRGDATGDIFTQVFSQGTKDQIKRREKIYNGWAREMETKTFRVKTKAPSPIIPKKSKKPIALSGPTVSTSPYAAPASGGSKYSISLKTNPNNASTSNPNNNSGGGARQSPPAVATAAISAAIFPRSDVFELEFDSSAPNIGISLNRGMYKDANGGLVEGMNFLKYNLDADKGSTQAANMIAANGGYGIDVRTFKPGGTNPMYCSNAWLTHYKLKKFTWTEITSHNLNSVFQRLKELTESVRMEKMLLPTSGLVLKFRLGKIPESVDGNLVGRTSPAPGYQNISLRKQDAPRRSNERQGGGSRGGGAKKLGELPADDRRFIEFAFYLYEMFQEQRYSHNGINIASLPKEYEKFCHSLRVRPDMDLLHDRNKKAQALKFASEMGACDLSPKPPRPTNLVLPPSKTMKTMFARKKKDFEAQEQRRLQEQLLQQQQQQQQRYPPPSQQRSNINFQPPSNYQPPPQQNAAARRGIERQGRTTNNDFSPRASPDATRSSEPLYDVSAPKSHGPPKHPSSFKPLPSFDPQNLSRSSPIPMKRGCKNKNPNNKVGFYPEERNTCVVIAPVDEPSFTHTPMEGSKENDYEVVASGRWDEKKQR